MIQRVLVVAAHPDDEVLGCGGTIARHTANGDEVRILFLADGVASRGDDVAEESLLARRRAGDAASQILKARPPTYLDYPDNRLDTIALLDLSKAIEEYTSDYQPTVIYTHFHGDLNVDHQLTQRAVLTAFRPLPGQSVRSIYCFEVLSSTNWAYANDQSVFSPTRFVDVSAFLSTKMRALNCYGAEMRTFPHARSYDAVRALAACRGASVGLQAAEAFMAIRELV